MRRFRAPEFALGVLATASIFAAGMALQSARQPPSENQSAANAKHGSGVVAPKESPDKLTDWLLVLFNGLLFGSTVLLWKANNRSAKIAERALTELERPHVFVEFDTSKLQGLVGGGISLIPYPIRIVCVNHGRTPADLLEFRDSYEVLPEGKFPQPFVPPAFHRTCPPGTIAGAGRPYEFTAELGKRTGRRDLSEPDNLFAIGYLRYADIFGARYIVGFCAHYDLAVYRFVLRGGEQYNYARREA